MTLVNIYSYLEQNNIKVKNVDLAGEKALSIPYKESYAIGIDKKSSMTDKEELVLVTHEAGHGETQSFYNKNNILDVYEKHEHRADVWAIKKLIPKEELYNAVCSGNCEMWQLADYFDLPQEFVEKAVHYYEGID